MFTTDTRTICFFLGAGFTLPDLKERYSLVQKTPFFLITCSCSSLELMGTNCAKNSVPFLGEWYIGRTMTLLKIKPMESPPS